MKQMNYEEAYAELQEILKKLQEGIVTVDDLTQKVKRAGNLLEFCQNKLRQTEEELNKLFDEE